MQRQLEVYEKCLVINKSYKHVYNKNHKMRSQFQKINLAAILENGLKQKNIKNKEGPPFVFSLVVSELPYQLPMMATLPGTPCI